MQHNEGSSDLKYEPQINDYVVWTTALGMIHEGWVYFKSTPTAPKRGWSTPLDYITIELGVKERPDYHENNPHKYIHVLLCCYEHQWGELRYVKRRKDKNDNTIIHEAEKGINFYNYYPDYKSQEHRYQDVQ